MLWHPLKVNSKRMFPPGKREELLLIPSKNISYQPCIFRPRGIQMSHQSMRELFSCHESGSGNLSNEFPPESEGPTVWHDGNNEHVKVLCLLLCWVGQVFHWQLCFAVISYTGVSHACSACREQREIVSPEEQKEAYPGYFAISDSVFYAARPEILKYQDSEHNVSICTKGIKRKKYQDLRGRKRRRAESPSEFC